MFSEKNLPKLIIITPIIAILIITIVTGYIFVETQNEYFYEENKRLEEDFHKKQKTLIKNQIQTIISYIRHQENLYTNSAIEKVIKETYTLETRINQLYNDLNYKIDTDLRKTILSNLINSKISNQNYFFAYDTNDDEIIQPFNKNIILEFKKDGKFFRNYLFFEKGKLIQFEYSNKIVYLAYIPKLNWIIGNIKNIQKDIDFIKKVALSYIQNIQFDKNGNIIVYNTKHILLADKYRKYNIGKSEKDLKINNEYIIRKFISQTSEDGNGKYIIHPWIKKNEKNVSDKISYVQAFDKWNWVLGAGLYIDDIQKAILFDKKKLEKRVNKYVQYIIIISIILMIIILALSILMSNKISKAFKSYQDKLKNEKIKLEYLNNTLQSKVQIGIDESLKKDRAMLHQSRLARLGTMISMIAHQWRQPLTEVSSILMELETATKFKKVDDKLILECTKESYKLLNYMSNTIDDFKNFFKPNKNMEEFSIINACLKALSIVDASLKNLQINLIKEFKEDSIVLAYPREFSQVILNIVLNCKDAFLEKNIKNAFIRFYIGKKENKTLILITDNAGGIKFENVDLIFDPYVTSKSSSKGTGLGLYMSKMIIEKNMNGKLSAKNTKNGVMFEILI